MKRIFILLLLLITASGCAVNPVSGQNDFVMMTEQQEIAQGQQMHQEIIKKFGVYDDPKLQAYVEKIGDELASQSHRNHLDFHFTVLDNPSVNAFALPGGYIYVERGILAYMNSEAELAGVLGHEIGHVTARHSVRQQSGSMVTSILISVVGSATGVPGASELSSVAGTAITRGYSRGYELESDRLGSEYLARSGYDPQTMTDVIELLKNQEIFEIARATEESREPQIYHGLFSTHPDNDKRLQEVVDAAEQYRSSQARPVNRKGFLEMTDGLVFGSNVKEGIVRGHRFYHGPLDVTLTFPENWRIDNQPDQLMVHTKKNDALIQMKLEDPGKAKTAREWVDQQFEDYTQGEAFKTEDFEGYALTTSLQTPYGEKPSMLAAFLIEDSVYVFAGATKSRSVTSAFRQEFMDTVESFRRLTPKEATLASVRHLRLIQTGQGDTYETLAAQYALGADGESQLRLLNGQYPDGEPRTGQWIKIIE